MVWLGACTGFVSDYQYKMCTQKYPASNAASKEGLGVTYRSMKETCRDCALSMIDSGFIKGRKK